jgi:hypothetical protein
VYYVNANKGATLSPNTQPPKTQAKNETMNQKETMNTEIRTRKLTERKTGQRGTIRLYDLYTGGEYMGTYTNLKDALEAQADRESALRIMDGLRHKDFKRPKFESELNQPPTNQN